MSAKLASNSSPLSLLTVLKPGGSSCFSADSKPCKLCRSIYIPQEHRITKEEYEKYKKYFKGVPEIEKW